MMYLLIGWCDGFGNDAYVKAVYATREEAVMHADTTGECPDKLIPFELGQEIDFDYDTAEMIHKKKKKRKSGRKKVDWELIAIALVSDEEFLHKHPYWLAEGDSIDDLLKHHHAWLEEEYHSNPERWADYYE